MIPFLGSGYCYRSNSGGFFFKLGPMLLFGGGKVSAHGRISRWGVAF